MPSFTAKYIPPFKMWVLIAPDGEVVRENDLIPYFFPTPAEAKQFIWQKFNSEITVWHMDGLGSL